jgi:hypothetical protein
MLTTLVLKLISAANFCCVEPLLAFQHQMSRAARAPEVQTRTFDSAKNDEYIVFVNVCS